MPEDEAAQEVWRAARSDPSANWTAFLSQPIVSACLNIALRSENAGAAVREATHEIVRTGQSSIAADIAKRAVARAFGAEDRRATYVSALFGEATNYLVSRDLPAYIGPRFRSPTIEAGAAFKDALCRRVESAVRQVLPPEPPRDAVSWARFVDSTARLLAGLG